MENSRFFRLPTISIIFLLLWGSLLAQEKYSLEKIIDLYKQNNIALKINKMEIDNAVSRKKIARAWENPLIRYTQEGINTGTQENPLKGRELQLTLEQRIPLSGRKGLQSKHAEQDINIASEEYQQIFWAGLSYIKALFYEIQSFTFTLDILEKMRLKLEELNAIIIENYKRGEASGIDTARIKMILKDIDLERYYVETSLDFKKRELLTLLDLSYEPSQIDFVEPYYQYVIKEEKEGLSQSLIENNPQIQILINSQKREEIQLSLEKRKNIPDLTAGGGYKKEDFYDTYLFYFSLNIPIFNQRRGEIEVAKNNLRMNELQQRLITKELLEVFEREYLKHLKSTELIQLFKAQYLNQADKLENTILAAYKGGEVNMLVLVDALQSVLKTRIEFTDLMLQNNVAIFNIEKMICREIELEKIQ
jgi:cobalt-zinc-cadmium efflux system outer membrane protein